jgi:hypothetical protein
MKLNDEKKIRWHTHNLTEEEKENIMKSARAFGTSKSYFNIDELTSVENSTNNEVSEDTREEVSSLEERVFKAVEEKTRGASVYKSSFKENTFPYSPPMPASDTDLAKEERRLLNIAEEKLLSKGKKEGLKRQEVRETYRGLLAKEEGPFLKIILTARHADLIGWIDYESPLLRRISGSRMPFVSSNGITISSGDAPALAGDSIHLLGKAKQLDNVLLRARFESTEAASEQREKFLSAFKEYFNILKGVDEEQEDISTKFSKDFIYIF